MLPLAALGAQEGGFTFEPDGINDGVVITKYDWREGAVTIPERLGTKVVTSIGYSAFSGFTGLTSVTVPNSVTSIGPSAFLGCTGLTSVSIGNSVTSIGHQAFYGCTGLTSVIIPNSVTSIGQEAFYGCTGLTSVTIPNSVIWIGDYAFIGCTGLTSVTIGNSVTSIGYRAFYGCTGLTSVSIGNSVTSIGGWAFSGCTGLTSVTIPNSVTAIGYRAFSGCTGLTSVSIGNSVTDIGDGTFSGCTSLTAIEVGALNAAYSSLGGVLFNKLQSFLLRFPPGRSGAYTIPDGVTSIADAAFSGCTALTSVSIGNSVTSIGHQAFYGCTGLPSVTIPNSVTSIGVRPFYGCTGLTAIEVDALNPAYSSLGGVLFNKLQSVLLVFPPGQSGAYTIPNSVTSIGSESFSGCTGLTSVNIGNSVTDIRAGTFSSCTGLTAIEVGALNAAYSSLGGVLFNKLQSFLLLFPPGRSGAYTIPDGVTSIGHLAFYGCTGLTSVTIPNSVTSIGWSAFSGCTGLTSVTIPNSVTSIEGYAFSGCTGLTSVTIPNSVTSIGPGAFSGCTGLTSVTIGNSVTEIGYLAFSGCTALTSVYCEGNAPQIEPLFDGSPLVIVYYLPGTAGWASLYSGRPTLVRKPVPLYSDWLQSTTLASRYPGASAPADDPDLDGMSNEAEMLAGTDPTESISRLVLERTPRPDELPEADRTPLQEGEHAFYIRTVPGKRYGVHTADLLGQWRLDRIVTATTSQARLVFSKPATAAFYRVILAE